MNTCTIHPREHKNAHVVKCDCYAPTCTNEICQTHTIPYLMGWRKPNYPMPAIPVVFDTSSNIWGMAWEGTWIRNAIDGMLINYVK